MLFFAMSSTATETQFKKNNIALGILVIFGKVIFASFRKMNSTFSYLQGG
jgi:hypothetical protein